MSSNQQTQCDQFTAHLSQKLVDGTRSLGLVPVPLLLFVNCGDLFPEMLLARGNSPVILLTNADLGKVLTV